MLRAYYFILFSGAYFFPVVFTTLSLFLQVWLAKKNLRFGVNDIGSHCIQLIVAYLFQARMIAPQTAVLSALQVVMNFIAGTAFDSTCLNFAGESRQNAVGGSTWAATLVHLVGKDADVFSSTVYGASKRPW